MYSIRQYFNDNVNSWEKCFSFEYIISFGINIISFFLIFILAISHHIVSIWAFGGQKWYTQCSLQSHFESFV